MAYRPSSLFTAATVSPSAAGAVSLLSRFLLTDATFATGAQLQTILGISTGGATGASTMSGVPANAVFGVPVSGVTVTLAPSGATGYAVLYSGGVDEGARQAFTGAALPSLTPLMTGSTTIRVYGATNAGPALVESAAFNVVMPVVPPGQVGSLVAGQSTSSTIAVTYTAPITGSAVISYSGKASLDGTTWVASGGSFGATGGSFTGLTPATLYHLEIIASNAGGSSTTVLPGTASTLAAGTGPANSYLVGWYGSAPATNFALSATYNGYKYGKPEASGYFKLTPAAGGGDVPNSTQVLCAWVASTTTAPVAAVPTAAGLNAANLANGYVTASAAAAPYYSDNASVAAPVGSTAQTVYFWASTDNGVTWSVWRDGSNNPIGVTVTF